MIPPDLGHEPLLMLSQVVYIPPGQYTITETIQMNTDTIIMGDATDVRPPTVVIMIQ